MKTVAVYSMKGGVGKTTTALNLSYVAAAAGQRTLLWDLDPQAASSFALRVEPHVGQFGKKSLVSSRVLAAAIKETDYSHLDLLPADFAYRKIDRFLEALGQPERVVAELVGSLGRDYDVVFLDCPAGFSRLSEGIVGAADLILAPTIPTVFSLRMVSQLLQWGARSGSTAGCAAFFSMVDRRKILHRRVCEWAGESLAFMPAEIPYASIAEQMTVRRAPLNAYAPRTPAAMAFEKLWTATRVMLERGTECGRNEHWRAALQAIDNVIVRLEASGTDNGDVSNLAAAEESFTSEGDLVHRFDTGDRRLEQCGCVLELREHRGSLVVVAVGRDSRGGAPRVQARIDRAWALQILTGEMSPLEVLTERLGHSDFVVEMQASIAGERLVRHESRVDHHVSPPMDSAPAARNLLNPHVRSLLEVPARPHVALDRHV